MVIDDVGPCVERAIGLQIDTLEGEVGFMIQGDIFYEFHILSFLSGSHIGVRHVFTKIKNELLHFCLVLGDVFDVEHEGNRKYIKAVEGVPGAMLP